MMHGMGWGGMWFGSFFGLAMIGLVVWAIISLVNNSNRNDASAQQESALDILKKRYASGEITQKEFEQMKKDLQ